MSKETKEVIDKLRDMDQNRPSVEVDGINKVNCWFKKFIKLKKELNQWKEKLLDEISSSEKGDLITDDIKCKLEEIKEIELALEKHGSEEII